MHKLKAQLLWERWAAAHELPALAAAICAPLRTTTPFCLWLEGEMGSGKTTLTGALLRSLGWPSDRPVTSPTYSYLNEYQIGELSYAHMDLYRADAGFAWEELGLGFDKPYAGLIIEWPTQFAEAFPATHRLSITYGDDPNLRHYQLYACSR